MSNLDNHNEAGEIRAVKGDEAINGNTEGGSAPGKAGKKDPEWASGLKHLYDSVVDEPIPDAFKALLAKLDDGSK